MATQTICKFVDSIAAAPTLRFDFNANASATTAECDLQREGTEFPMPPLLRSVSFNAMRDGGYVSSSNYGMRSVRLRAHVKDASPDKVSTTLQALYRELDRADNFLMWQPKGASKPVFFRTFRSSPESLDVKFSAALGLWIVTLDILAEPFALGLRETLGPFTVNNDPANGSNGCFVDLTGVIGDVETPCVVINTSRTVALGVLAVRQHGTPSDMQWFMQAESALLAIDTTNPGGGPDAAMSGTGTNNFVRTSFATFTTMVGRVQWTPSWTDAQGRAMRGTFRVWAVVRRSDSTSDMSLQLLRPVAADGAVVVLPKNTGRQLVDLGLHSFGGNGVQTGYGAENSLSADYLIFAAERSSGSGTLDWDVFMLTPADEAALIFTFPGTVSTGFDFVVDGYHNEMWSTTSAAAAFDGTANPEDSYNFSMSGGFPTLVPNQTNRMFFLETGASNAMTKGDTSSLEFHYWPRYLSVRPSST